MQSHPPEISTTKLSINAEFPFQRTLGSLRPDLVPCLSLFVLFPLTLGTGTSCHHPCLQRDVPLQEEREREREREAVQWSSPRLKTTTISFGPLPADRATRT